MSRLGTVASAVLTKYYTGAGIMSTPDAPDLTIDGDVRFKAKVRRAALTPSGTLFLQLHSGRADLLNEYRTDASTPAADAYRIGRWAPAQATRNMLAGTEVNQIIPAETDVHIGYTMVNTDRTRFQAIRSDNGSTWVNVGTAYVELTNVLGGFPDDPATLRVGYQWQGRIYWAQMEAINRAQLVFPGQPGNYLSVPDAANLDITDDIEIVARVAPVSWRPAAQTAICGKYTTTANQRSFTFAIATSGQLVFTISTTGGDFLQHMSNILPANSGPMWLKTTRVRSTGAVNFYTAPDGPTEPTTWTNLGPTGTIGVGVGMFSSSAPIEIGAIATGAAQQFAGRIARVILRNGVGGTTVLDVSENNAGTMATASTFLATSGQTVTVNSTGQVPYLDPASNVSSPDPGVLPTQFTVIQRAWLSVIDGTSFPYACRQNDGADPRSYQLYRGPLSTNLGRWFFDFTTDGVWATRVARSTLSPDQPTPVAGVDETVAIAVATDNGSGRFTMRTSTYNPATATWTPATLRDAGAAAIPFDVTTPVRVGAGFPAGSRVYSVEMRTGLDPAAGSVIWRFDAAEFPGGAATSYVDPRGRTWTLNVAGAILPAVAPIVQPQPDSLVWRFDAADAPFTGTSYTDPRGRTWTMPAGAIVGI